MNDNMCIICFADMEFFDCTKTECNHKFHYKCLLQWYRRHDSCPMCRHELYFIQSSLIKYILDGRKYI